MPHRRQQQMLFERASEPENPSQSPWSSDWRKQMSDIAYYFADVMATEKMTF